MLNLPIGKKLTWKQDSWSGRAYTLEQDGQPLAHLNYTGTFNHEALIRPSADDSDAWSFKFDRKGAFSPTVTGKATDTAVPDMQPMRLDWLGKGELRLANGRSYRWKPLDNWHNRWGFEDEDGRVVIEFKQNAWSGGGSFVVNDNSLKANELNLLANLGWYKSINHAQEMAALFVIIVAVVVAM